MDGLEALTKKRGFDTKARELNNMLWQIEEAKRKCDENKDTDKATALLEDLARKRKERNA